MIVGDKTYLANLVIPVVLPVYFTVIVSPTQGVVSDTVKSFEADSFSVILHDPPRFALAGELYSESFYRELYRVLREGGRMLHYIGSPGSKYRGKDLISGIQRRLDNCGFHTERTEDNESILAYK